MIKKKYIYIYYFVHARESGNDQVLVVRLATVPARKQRGNVSWLGTEFLLDLFFCFSIVAFSVIIQ